LLQVAKNIVQRAAASGAFATIELLIANGRSHALVEAGIDLRGKAPEPFPGGVEDETGPKGGRQLPGERVVNNDLVHGFLNSLGLWSDLI
jgi:hypothetical protein